MRFELECMRVTAKSTTFPSFPSYNDQHFYLRERRTEGHM